MMQFEFAIFYHGIRGQSSLKLYGLILGLEVSNFASFSSLVYVAMSVSKNL